MRSSLRQNLLKLRQERKPMPRLHRLSLKRMPITPQLLPLPNKRSRRRLLKQLLLRVKLRLSYNKVSPRRELTSNSWPRSTLLLHSLETENPWSSETTLKTYLLKLRPSTWRKINPNRRIEFEFKNQEQISMFQLINQESKKSQHLQERYYNLQKWSKKKNCLSKLKIASLLSMFLILF